MRILGVGGCASGVGKTTLICRLLPSLGEWTVLKTSPESAVAGGSGYRLVDDEADLRRPGSDTDRYLEAGAARVLWLRYGGAALGPGLRAALRASRVAPGLIVEGTSFLRHRPADHMLLVARAGRDEIKPSAREALPGVDCLVLNRGRDVSTAAAERQAEAFRREYRVGLTLVVNLADAGDPALRRLTERIRAWSRSRS